ncbi:hypothetical protein RA269_29730, partial [Pseudomonas syringae pv. tagetis]|uniref:hypothetical protein n=1 Tax=Pseudomonas syringae group genomosp. 7 TaxID=251699 RepID=UPI0037700362
IHVKKEQDVHDKPPEQRSYHAEIKRELNEEDIQKKIWLQKNIGLMNKPVIKYTKNEDLST